MPKIGIDIGRVIISGDTDSTSSFFGDNYLQTNQLLHAFEGVQHLINVFGAEHVFLVSKCSEVTQQRTLAWLSHHSFYEFTGLFHHHIHFCRERAEKAGICEQLGIDIFIDDRFSVLQHLGALKQLYLFNPSEQELMNFQTHQESLPITVVKNWDEVIRQFPNLG